jgi:hypothetical protein
MPNEIDRSGISSAVSSNMAAAEQGPDYGGGNGDNDDETSPAAADRILVQAQRDDMVERLAELSRTAPPFKVQKRKILALEKFDPYHHHPGGGNKTSISSSTLLIPMVDGTERTIDTHWDYLLKEMQWLATDFTTERARHVTFRKKLGAAIVTYQTNKILRHQKIIDRAISSQKKIATKIARDIRVKWWTKLEQIVSYQDKNRYETLQKELMNRQLVRLIRQTERYNAKSLSTTQHDNAIERPWRPIITFQQNADGADGRAITPFGRKMRVRPPMTRRTRRRRILMTTTR